MEREPAAPLRSRLISPAGQQQKSRRSRASAAWALETEAARAAAIEQTRRT